MAARPTWSGQITFGLVTIPVKLFTAVRDVGVHFHMLTPDGKCRLRRKLYCPDDGKEYEYSETKRGYEIAPNQYVVIEDEDIEKAQPEAARSIDILDFVDLTSIDPIYFDRPYYLLPDGKSEKPFQLLLDAMASSERIGVAKFVMRTNEYLAAIRPYQHILCLHTMHFDEEIVDLSTLDYEPKKASTDKRELALAEELIDKLYADFDPDKYKHEEKERIMRVIEQKSKGKKIVATGGGPASQPTKVVDLLEVLKRSVAKGGKAEEPKERTRAAAKRAPREKAKQSSGKKKKRA